MIPPFIKFRFVNCAALVCSTALAQAAADCAWEVKEYYRSPAPALNSLTDALNLIADPSATVLVSTPGMLNCNDPDSTGGGGFFPGDDPFASDNKTPQGLLNGDDNDFAIMAGAFISITVEDDYTFGFSSSEGARLRIVGASFASSTRVNAANPANPAHSGDTLSFPGLTDNSATLGVCHLTPGTYQLEFVTWERTGGAHAEVFAARGAKTAIDNSFRLIGDTAAGGSLTAGTLTALPVPQPWTQEFEDGSGGFVVSNINGPFEGPWTRDAVNGTWDTAGQGSEAVVAPSTLLTGPSITMQCSGDATLQFIHRHSFEEGNWDGGQVRLSVNGGPFTLVPNSAFSQGGYNGTVAPTSIADIRGQQAFVVDSTGYAIPIYITSTALLGTFNAGDTLRVQFLASYDRNNRRGIPAWEIDSVSIEQQCAGGTPGWEVTTIRNGADSLATALNQIFAHWSGNPQPNTLTSLAGTVNFEGPGAGGGHGPSVPFPGDTAGDDDQFALGARATLNVPVAGDYTFCLLADDSARLRIPGSRAWSAGGGPATLVDGFFGGGGGDVFGQVHLTGGTHTLELVFHENSGNALLGLWAARGRYNFFDPNVFSPVGGSGLTRAEAPFALTRQAGQTRPVNDDFVAASRLDAALAVACTAGAGLQAGEPGVAGIGATVWWQWQAPAAGTYVFNTAGSDFDTVLTVFTGSVLTSLTQVAAGDNYGASASARVTLTVPSAGPYKIQAAGAGGATGRLMLQVQAAATPPNNAFSAATALGSPYSVSIAGTNDAATAEGSEPAHVTGLPARSSVWYTWTAPATGDWLLDTRGSGIDTVLAVYTGASLAALTKLASHDDLSGAEKQSAVTLRAAAGTLYRIAVDGKDAAARGDVRLNITHLAAVTSAQLLSGPQPNSPRTFRLTLRSEPWTTWRIESSPNLSTWSSAVSGLYSQGSTSVLDAGGLPAATPRQHFRVRRE